MAKSKKSTKKALLGTKPGTVQYNILYFVLLAVFVIALVTVFDLIWAAVATKTEFHFDYWRDLITPIMLAAVATVINDRQNKQK